MLGESPYTRYNDYRGPMHLLPHTCKLRKYRLADEDVVTFPIIAVVGEYNEATKMMVRYLEKLFQVQKTNYNLDMLQEMRNGAGELK